MSIFADLFGITRSNNIAEKAAADALAQQKATAAAEQANREAMANMQKNFATDLTNTNKATVVAGGAADMVTQASDLIKKKPTVGGLASTLGLTL